jgi:hypothetical protein
MPFERFIPLFLLLALDAAAPAILATADFSNYQSSGNAFGSNFAGVSLNFSEIYLSAMNTSLFQGYFANSKAFGSVNSMLGLSIKTQSPKGYKYNCSAYAGMGINITCIYSYSSVMTKMGTFVKAAGPYSNTGVAVGFDMENANFSNPAFSSYFSTFTSAMVSSLGSGFYYIPIEVFDGADQYSANGILPNYTAANFVNDMNSLLALNPYQYYYGPGISQSADPSWLATYNTFKGNPYIGFTVKCVIFNTTNNFTIADVLN